MSGLGRGLLSVAVAVTESTVTATTVTVTKAADKQGLSLGWWDLLHKLSQLFPVCLQKGLRQISAHCVFHDTL